MDTKKMGFESCLFLPTDMIIVMAVKKTKFSIKYNVFFCIEIEKNLCQFFPVI